MTSLECLFLAIVIGQMATIVMLHLRITRMEAKLNGVFWTNGAWWRRG